jgi:hypothetical protein
MTEFEKEKIEDAVVALQEGGASLEDILEALTAVVEDIEEAIALKQPYGIYE